MATKIEKRIKIACKGADLKPHYELVELQGDLKELDKENYERLKSQILTYGFSEPVSVYQNPDTKELLILNGHQRVRVVTRQVQEGYSPPLLPISYIEAESLDEAKRKLLAFASQYGSVTDQGLYEYLISSDIYPTELNNSFRLPEINTDKFMAEFFDIHQPEDLNPVPLEPFTVTVLFENESDRDILATELKLRKYLTEVN